MGNTCQHVHLKMSSALGICVYIFLRDYIQKWIAKGTLLEQEQAVVGWSFCGI